MTDRPMRDTDYATELARGSVTFPDGTEGRIERLRFKDGPDAGLEGIRFSWRKDGKMIPRPLDGTEGQLLGLLENAIREGVFSEDFLAKLRHVLGTPT
jgi:hypothetical protein